MTTAMFGFLLISAVISFVTTTDEAHDHNHKNHLVDLSHVYSNDTHAWMTHRTIEIKYVAEWRTSNTSDEKYWYQGDEISLSTHCGTHMDSPCHFANGTWCMDDIPIEHYVDRPAAVIDISEKCLKNRDYQLTVEDLTNWETGYGRIPDEAVLFIRTNWGQFWSNRMEYFGTDTTDTSLAHFPTVSPESAQWLVDNRKVVGVAIESPSVDFATGFKSHVILSARNIYILENINNDLYKLPSFGATVNVFPINIKGASGAPCRVIANLAPNYTFLMRGNYILTLVAILMSLKLC